MGRRPERLAEEMREEIARMIVTEVKDPRLGFVTVTRVEVAHDLRYARVHVGVLGGEAEREKSLTALRSAAGFIRRELGRRLRIHHSPEVDFRYDKGIDATDRVARLLAEEAAREKPAGEGEGGVGLSWTASSSWTSRAHVARRRRPRAPCARDAAGGAHRHADPFATGSSRLRRPRHAPCLGFLSGGEKEYVATVRLGFATTTDDRTGEPLGAPVPVDVAPAALAAALDGLVGSFDQVPPAFSAKHVGGRRLYELARRGETVPRAATPVTVHAIPSSPEADTVEIAVRCSPGTYVRALARDLGERLGTGAHLTALRRTRSGPFDLSQSVSGDDLAGAAERMIPLAGLLLDLPVVTVAAEGRRLVGHGRELGPGDVVQGFPEGPVERVRVLDESGALLALAVPKGLGGEPSALPRVPALHPDVVLVD
jgi:tRNA pseudouridine55 synthase